jgi:3-deoxy-D-manno-octulosonic-acid transferase
LYSVFFSPSGYEVRKNYALADHVAYLPLDTPANARYWLDHFQPEVVFFIKYELWLHYLGEMQRQKIPAILVSAQLRPDSSFLRSPMKGLYRKAYQGLAHIFVQNEETRRLLEAFTGQNHITLSGDTRYDRVLSNYENSEAISTVKDFVGERLCIMGGSTWPKGEKMLLEAFAQLKDRYPLCLILAPHEIQAKEIRLKISQAPGQRLRFSDIENCQASHEILWIDNVGMLSSLYRYADVAYVGGGWGTGLHNILEPAVFGCPVIFGPRFDKFPEASALIEAGGGFSIAETASLQNRLEKLLADGQLRQQIKQQNQQFIREQAGATEMVMRWYDKKQNRTDGSH